MRGQMLGCFLLATLALPVSAHAISYKVLVTASDGPLDGVFLDLVTLKINYELDPNVPDSSADPNTGIFPDAVLSLSVEIPGIDGFVAAGPAGPVETEVNLVAPVSGDLYDAASFAGGPITSSNLVLQVTSLEVDFLSDLVAPPAEPKMLDGDELPTARLFYKEGILLLGSGAGLTRVTFEPVDTIEDDGCAIASPGRDASRAGAWLLLLPALLVWTRRLNLRRATSNEPRATSNE